MSDNTQISSTSNDILPIKQKTLLHLADQVISAHKNGITYFLEKGPKFLQQLNLQWKKYYNYLKRGLKIKLQAIISVFYENSYYYVVFAFLRTIYSSLINSVLAVFVSRQSFMSWTLEKLVLSLQRTFFVVLSLGHPLVRKMSCFQNVLSHWGRIRERQFLLRAV